MFNSRIILMFNTRINKRYIFHLLLLMLLLSSCATYKQNIMFRTEDKTYGIKSAIDLAEKNYRIQANDILDVQVYTNNGERLIDPNLQFDVGARSNNTNTEKTRPQYLVQKDGNVRLPMVGLVKLENYTLPQADSLLQEIYSTYYKDAFVYTKYLNKRVFVLGGVGGGGGGSAAGASSGRGGGRVVPLENEDMHLIELLASVGGIGGQSKANNIRLIRGDLKNPYVEIIDLTTIEGMKRATLRLEPNDIIYIEPLRRPFFEALRDVSSVVSFISAIGSFTISTILLTRALNGN